MAILHYILLSSTFIVWTRACKDKFECFSKARRGRFVIGTVLKEKNVMRFSDCLGDCGRHCVCKSLNYNKFTGKCELMDNHTQRAEELSLDFDNKDFINSVAPTTPKPQICIENPCGHSEVCYEYKQHNRVCLPECGETPIPSGGSGTAYAFNDVGQRRKTNCPANHTYVGKTERTCLPNKDWSPLECFEVCHFSTVCSSWIDDDRFSESKFRRHNGDTSTSGPSNYQGHYLYFEAGSLSPGEKAAIHTIKTIPANEQVCLDLVFNMYNEKNSKYFGTLYVKSLITGDDVLTEKVVINDSFYKGNLWRNYHKKFAPKSKSFKLYIMAEKGNGVQNDIAIDNVKVHDCTSNDDRSSKST